MRSELARAPMTEVEVRSVALLVCVGASIPRLGGRGDQREFPRHHHAVAAGRAEEADQARPEQRQPTAEICSRSAHRQDHTACRTRRLCL